MISRRDFLSKAAITGAGVALRKDLKEFAIPYKHVPSFSLLLGTVESQMYSNPGETIQKIADIGFKGLEYPDNYGLSSRAMKEIINTNHLLSIGGGDTMANLEKKFEHYIEEYTAMEKKYILCYWPWPDDGKNKTIEDWKANCDKFNALGKRFKEAGLRLGYHNHDIEFVLTEGRIPYDIVLQYTDPEYVAIQMDIWWIYTGKQDPVRFITQYPGRFELCHIKTREVLAGDASVTGLDYKRILSYSGTAGFREYILENEKGIADPFLFIRKSFNYLKTLF